MTLSYFEHFDWQKKQQKKSQRMEFILLKKITFSESLLFGLYDKILYDGNNFSWKLASFNDKDRS